MNSLTDLRLEKEDFVIARNEMNPKFSWNLDTKRREEVNLNHLWAFNLKYED